MSNYKENDYQMIRDEFDIVSYEVVLNEQETMELLWENNGISYEPFRSPTSAFSCLHRVRCKPR